MGFQEGGGSDTFKTISVSGQDDVVADSETDTLTLSASGGISISTDASNDTINLSYDGVSSVSPLEWTASSSTHSYDNLTITTSSNSSIGYIRSTNSLKGPCMMSFKISSSGGTPQFYAGLATNVGNAHNFPGYSEHSYYQIWDDGYAHIWEIGNDHPSRTTITTTNRTHRYTIIYTGTSLRFYLDNVLQTTVSRNEDLEHYAMFKFNPGHTSISEYDIHFEKEQSDYFNVGSGTVNNATTTSDGLLSSSDKVKLDGISGGGGSEAFKTISVSGQDDVVADSGTDTLTLSSSGGISISTDASNDTVNLSYGGEHSISPLDWTASSSTHSYDNLTITSSSNSSIGYI